MTALPATAFVEWQARPPVWLLVVSVIALGLYVVRVVGPNAVAPGEAITTPRQRIFFWLGVLVLWMSSDWPMHDIAESHLYSVHMVQHFLLTFVVPPLFLLATPTWLARLVIGHDNGTERWLKRLANPVAAGVIFNAVIIVTHWPEAVNLSVEIGPLHYLIHLAAVAAAFLMWTPVCGPIPEWRMRPPGQMIYLFLMSIVPTVPAAWLTLADNPVYASYDHAQRFWGLDVVSDQQLAGLFMKLGGGVYLWMIIAFMFFTWAAGSQSDDRQRRRPVRDGELTWNDVEREFERLGPAPESASETDTGPRAHPGRPQRG